MHEHHLIVLSTVLLIGIGCQWLAWRVKLPAILFLLMSGIALGPLFGWLQPDLLFGELLFPFISLAVAVILFEGSLTLNFRDVAGLTKVIRNMITFGALVTWLITAVSTRWLLHFSWEVSLLFGALMVVTGPTVIVPMLRTVRPKENVAHILRWEGILIDPIGATMAVLVYEIIVAGGTQNGLGAGAVAFFKILAIGAVLGGGGGALFGMLLQRHWIPHYLQNFAALALVCAIFTVSNVLEAEAGLLSVTFMGIWLANLKEVDLGEILNFKESLSVVLISMLFVLLAARMDLASFLALGWPALAVFAAIQFLARPLNVQISALGSKLTMAERHLLSWIAPRGIVAAAISALFAIKLDAIGYPQAVQMVPLTFMVIIGTVLLQSATAGAIARWLKVMEPEPRGFLIIGANRVARAIGVALMENGVKTVLADSTWEEVKRARMEGLPVYWGHPVSEHADRHLSLIGIGRLLALTANGELNALAVKHYRLEFGAGNLFVVRLKRTKYPLRSEKAPKVQEGNALFPHPVSHHDLDNWLAGGAELKTTLLTEKFRYSDYLKQSGGQRIPLFAIDPRGRVFPVTERSALAPAADWRIIGLSTSGQKMVDAHR